MVWIVAYQGHLLHVVYCVQIVCMTSRCVSSDALCNGSCNGDTIV